MLEGIPGGNPIGAVEPGLGTMGGMVATRAALSAQTGELAALSGGTACEPLAGTVDVTRSRLEEVIVNSLLDARPSRALDRRAENEALTELAQTMADAPHLILQKLVETAARLCQAGSAGVSLLEKQNGREVFRWEAVAGVYGDRLNQIVPREECPCGVTIERNATQLMYMAERCYPYLKTSPPFVEAMLVPFHFCGRPIGTFWVAAHDERRKFDREDERVIKVLALFASAGWQLWKAAQDSEERVKERTANLRESLKSLEGVLYHVAHDLRTPLRTMHSFTQLLVDRCAPNLDATGEEYAGIILDASRRMDLLIHDLLDYGRLGYQSVDFAAVDLAAIVDTVLAEMKEDVKTGKAVIQVDSPLPCVKADARVLKQVLTNLLSNALKFVPRGEVPRIRIWAQPDLEKILVCVEDKGIGIAPEYHDRIFGVFERLHTDSEYPGTGIGLAIVKKGMERLRGRIAIESKPGEGSRFWLELKACPAAEAVAQG